MENILQLITKNEIILRKNSEKPKKFDVKKFLKRAAVTVAILIFLTVGGIELMSEKNLKKDPKKISEKVRKFFEENPNFFIDSNYYVDGRPINSKREVFLIYEKKETGKKFKIAIMIVREKFIEENGEISFPGEILTHDGNVKNDAKNYESFDHFLKKNSAVF